MPLIILVLLLAATATCASERSVFHRLLLVNEAREMLVVKIKNTDLCEAKESMSECQRLCPRRSCH
jgi:hypothetical protein